MDMQDWKIISTLYKHKNITKTAETLYMSQPALTARIKRIEKHYNITLVLRHRRGVEFTADGEYLVKWAHTFIKQHEQIHDHLQNVRNEITGTLKIGVTKYLAKYKLPKILLQFKEMYPLVEFQVKTGWSSDIYRLVLNQDVHVGIIRGDYPWRGVKELLFEESLCVSYTKPFELEDLPNLPRISYDTDNRLKEIVDHWWANQFTVSPRTIIEVDQVDTCKEMIIHGLGYGILPQVIMQDHPNIYNKILVNQDGTPLIRKTSLYYHENIRQLKMVNKFISFIKDINVNEV